MWFNKLSCNIGTIPGAAQAIFNFAPCYIGICSCVAFHDALLKYKLRPAKYGERVGPANQLQQTLILDYLDWWLFRTSKNCFSPTFKVESTLIISFLNWQFFAERTNCHMYTWFHSAISWRSTAFPTDVTRLSPSPCFWGKSLGTRILNTQNGNMPLWVWGS